MTNTYQTSWDSSPFDLESITDNNLGLLAKSCSEQFCHAGINGLDLWISLEEVSLGERIGSGTRHDPNIEHMTSRNSPNECVSAIFPKCLKFYGRARLLFRPPDPLGVDVLDILHGFPCRQQPTTALTGDPRNNPVFLFLLG